IIANWLAGIVRILGREVMPIGEILDDGRVRPVVAPLVKADLYPAFSKVEGGKHHPAGECAVEPQGDPVRCSGPRNPCFYHQRISPWRTLDQEDGGADKKDNVRQEQGIVCARKMPSNQIGKTGSE